MVAHAVGVLVRRCGCAAVSWKLRRARTSATCSASRHRIRFRAAPVVSSTTTTAVWPRSGSTSGRTSTITLTQVSYLLAQPSSVFFDCNFIFLAADSPLLLPLGFGRFFHWSGCMFGPVRFLINDSCTICWVYKLFIVYLS